MLDRTHPQNPQALPPVFRDRHAIDAGSPDEVLSVLAEIKAALSEVLLESHQTVDSLVTSFKLLAGQSCRQLQLASEVIGHAEGDLGTTVLPQVRPLCGTLTEFLQLRLNAVSPVSTVLNDFGNLLAQMAWTMRRLQAIARQFRALSIQTKVEVAQLGELGSNFQHLLQELTDFTATISRQTEELAQRTQERQTAIEKTRRTFAADLPLLRSQMGRIESDVSGTVEAINKRLRQLSDVPEQFKSCVQQTACEIDAVVSAIQGYDITRQQIEHVGAALDLLSEKLRSCPDWHSASCGGQVQAGLRIQIAQLQAIANTRSSWSSQIATCTRTIQELSASDLAAIAPVVLSQEHELGDQLARLENFEQLSHGYGSEARSALAGVSGLLELVNEHLQRSDQVYERLSFLTINSTIAATHIGTEGAVVSAIASLINAASRAWNLMTEQSRSIAQQIVSCSKQTEKVMHAFSDASAQKLHKDQLQVRATLESIRMAANRVASNASQMESLTFEMKTTAADVCETEHALSTQFERITQAIAALQAVSSRLERHAGGPTSPSDQATLRRLFSELFTTEAERVVMQAVLSGSIVPLPQTTLTGNAVELF